MTNNNSWKDIEVEVPLQAKAKHSYVAKVTNVKETEKNGEPAFKLTYTVRNIDGNELTVSKTVQEKFFKKWLSFHNGFDANDAKPLRNIAEFHQLILTDEYKSHVYVAKVIPMESYEVNRHV